jgi:gas vesicle protein
MKTGKVLLGLLAGIATGALMGILFAPEKGEVTRKRISGKCNDYADDINDAITDMTNTIKDKYESAIDATEEMIATGKQKLHDAKKEFTA